MPVIVKDYIWRQTDDRLTINVPLKGIHHSKVDIFTTESYVKASYTPFLFELFLFAAVNESESKCTMTESEIIFELQKAVTGHWGSVVADLDKKEMLARRREIIEKFHEKTEGEQKDRKERFCELKRTSVRQQIARDTTTRHLIEDRRNAARNKAMEELEEWKNTKMTIEDVTEEEGKEIFGNGVALLPNIQESLAPLVELGDEADSESEEESKPPENKGEIENQTSALSEREQWPRLEVLPMPLPRRCGTIAVSFTPREFPTPSRESQAPQEDEWLRKQAAARRATGFVAEDLRPEECNATWLKDKGDSFYKVGNYLGAVSAYSHAIKLGFKMASLYSNRAAAHIGLGNLHKALEDSSQALELLTPHCESNAAARAKCHARRGAALCRLKVPEAGLADLERALQLTPGDQKLLADIETAKIMIANKTEDDDDPFDGLEIVPQP